MKLKLNLNSSKVLNYENGNNVEFYKKIKELSAKMCVCNLLF